MRNITLNELFGRNKKPPQNSNANGKTMYNQQASNVYGYTNNNERSKYTNNGNNSKFNGQESRQSNRKKSLSRT